MEINILSYATKTDTYKNILSVDFVIKENRPLIPKDYEPVYEGLLKFCANFKTADQRPNG